MNLFYILYRLNKRINIFQETFNSDNLQIRMPANRVCAWPEQGDFNGHPDALILTNIYQAINKLNLWQWLFTISLCELKELNFPDIPEIIAINKETNNIIYTKESFIFLEHMEKIAKEGWVEYFRNTIHPEITRKIK